MKNTFRFLCVKGLEVYNATAYDYGMPASSEGRTLIEDIVVQRHSPDKVIAVLPTKANIAAVANLLVELIEDSNRVQE